MSVADRFYAKIEKDPATGCWLWCGCIDQFGYGRLLVGSRKQGNTRGERAHRVSYRLHVGAIPEGRQIDHLCRVRHCVNPEHLEAVTQQENIRRGEVGSNMRVKTHCPAGHAYAGDNLLITKNGGRKCRACHRKTARRSRERMKQCR